MSSVRSGSRCAEVSISRTFWLPNWCPVVGKGHGSLEVSPRSAFFFKDSALESVQRPKVLTSSPCQPQKLTTLLEPLPHPLICFGSWWRLYERQSLSLPGKELCELWRFLILSVNANKRCLELTIQAEAFPWNSKAGPALIHQVDHKIFSNKGSSFIFEHPSAPVKQCYAGCNKSQIKAHGQNTQIYNILADCNSKIWNLILERTVCPLAKQQSQERTDSSGEGPAPPSRVPSGLAEWCLLGQQ